MSSVPNLIATRNYSGLITLLSTCTKDDDDTILMKSYYTEKKYHLHHTENF